MWHFRRGNDVDRNSMNAALLSDEPSSTKMWSIRTVFSYIFDYVVIIGCIVGFSLLDKIEPHHQRFSLTNISLQYPFADPERVSPTLAALLVVLAPAVVIVIFTIFLDGLFSHHKHQAKSLKFFGPHSIKDRLWQLNAGMLGLLLSVSASITITAAIKNIIGKPRPDLIARCMPQLGSADALVFGLTTSTICTQTDNAILKDGFRSFPSGHSSTSFAGLGFLAFFLAGKLHVLDNRGEVWKTVLVLIPLLGAGIIASTRIMDARHHGFDVITGSLLGLLVAWMSYRQYYPPLHQYWRKGRAYDIRTWGVDREQSSNNYKRNDTAESDWDQDADSPIDRTSPRRGDKHYSPEDVELGNRQPSAVKKDRDYSPPPPTMVGAGAGTVGERFNVPDGRYSSGDDAAYSNGARMPTYAKTEVRRPTSLPRD